MPCPDTNDLALNALDCLHKITGHQGLLLPALPSQLHSALLAELCHAMAAHETPLRVRMGVPGVLQRLALVTENVAPLAQAAGHHSLLVSQSKVLCRNLWLGHFARQCVVAEADTCAVVSETVKNWRRMRLCKASLHCH